MCDSRQAPAARPQADQEKTGSPSVDASNREKPKTCRCDRPCCRGELIKKAAEAAGEADS